MCCLNLGSVLNIYKNFLHFAKVFTQKENRTVQKNIVFNVSLYLSG